jgi:DNA recombination protein RmuC
MRDLATGVGDLKRVLTNVKTRGTWGEIQLGLLLEEILTPEQYARNVATKAGSNERVEFALRLPGRADTDGQTVWLPIDAKFPKEDYERLLAAQERADPEAAEESGGRLEEQIRRFARDIRDKYISPPGTTDFAVLFVPVEGLYAEVVRRPGLVEALQRDCRVVVAGPTTLAALLNSLQMGFRTLAIQKRSSEVWKLLGAVKTEFGRFGETLEAVQKKLHQASDSLEDASRRTRLIERRLKDVEELPAAESRSMLAERDVPALPEGEAE